MKHALISAASGVGSYYRYRAVTGWISLFFSVAFGSILLVGLMTLFYLETFGRGY